MEHRSISAPPVNYDGNGIAGSNGSTSGFPALYGLSNNRPEHERSNSDNILDIIGAGEAGVSAPTSLPSLNNIGMNGEMSNNNGDGVDDILSHRPRSLEDEKYSSSANYFGLNMVRSQSAAPDIFSHLSPGYGRRSAANKPLSSPNIDDEDAIFGRSRFFDEEEEDREALMQAATRRPASTGIIGRPSTNDANNNSSINSILETLGLAPSNDYSSDEQPPASLQNNISSYATNKSLGGIGNSGSIIGNQSPGKQSMIDKIHDGAPTPSRASKYFTTQDENHINLFSKQSQKNDYVASSESAQMGLQNNFSLHSPTNVSSASQNYAQYPSSGANGSLYQTASFSSNGVSDGNVNFMNQGSVQAGHLHPQLLHQMQQQTQPHQLHQNQSPYDQHQQSLYYLPQQQQPPQQHPHQQSDPRSQQPNLNIIHNAPQTNQVQPTVYHINAPAPQYGFDYHSVQQHQQQHPHGTPPTNHIVLPHHPPGAHMGQPQYISIVPIQTSQMLGGHPSGAYAYVQYGGDGVPIHSQPTVVSGAPPAFVLGAHHIPVNAPSGVTPLNIHYGSESSSPTNGGVRTPSRGGALGPKSPDRGHRSAGGIDGRGPGSRGQGRGGLSSPRGKRNDPAKNAVAISKLSPVASNLLNEIRSAKSRNQWTIHDINGYIVEFCLDQNGSRFIQQRLEVADAIEKRAVMDDVLPAVKDLQNDVFGNYVVQKLFEFGTDEMKKDLKGTLKGNMLSLSLQMYGCRVVQKALESLDYEDLCELLVEFQQNVLTCIQDQNGNHVMQKCIEVMSVKAKEAEMQSGTVGLSVTLAERIQFIVDDVLANVESLCCHPYGCRVLQRMLEHCVEFQKVATLDEIRLCHKTLLDDQYGNYVIQHVLQYGRESDRDSLLQIIVDNDLLKLSRQKFASNVVEKLLKYGNSPQRNAIVREMLKVVGEGGTSQEGVGSSVLLLMVRDAYANYVVQTAIDVVPEGNEKYLLLEELKANEVQLRNYTFAKHIVAKLGAK